MAFGQYILEMEVLVTEARGGVEDTRLEAKAKDTKKIRGQGQGQPFRGQTLEAKDRNARGQGQGPRTQALVLSKNKKSSQKKSLHKNFSSDLQKKKKFYNSKNSAVLEPRTGQFSRT